MAQLRRGMVASQWSAPVLARVKALHHPQSCTYSERARCGVGRERAQRAHHDMYSLGGPQTRWASRVQLVSLAVHSQVRTRHQGCS